MNALEKDSLLTEAKMQIKALDKINQWRKLAIIVSAIGIAVAYAGIAGTPSHLFLGILGVFLTLLGAVFAVLTSLGLKSGRRNVEKMIYVMNEGKEG